MLHSHQARPLDPALLARRALAATQLSEPFARLARLLRLASRSHTAIAKEVKAGGKVDARLLEIAHGVFLETNRQARDTGASMPEYVEMSKILEQWLSELKPLPYDRTKALQFALQLAE